uniref:Uncharacterized protein n=6 Tax=Triticinae TaxID=1648030 RepID=A0A453BBT5_AEGTS
QGKHQVYSSAASSSFSFFHLLHTDPFRGSISPTMPRLLLLCLVSSHFAVTAVMARQFPVFLVDGGAMAADAPSASASDASRLHRHSLLESRFAGSPMGSSDHGLRHGPFDRHFAGGKIILGGLAVAIIAAVFCYIRITRAKKIVEPKT